MGISFDTLDYARDLVTAEHNLMACMDSMKTGLEGKIDSTRNEIAGEITLLKWMLGMLTGLCVTILVKLLFA